MNRLLSDAELERHILDMAMFLIMLYAGLLLVNYLESCPHGRYGLASPCHDPLEDIRSC